MLRMYKSQQNHLPGESECNSSAQLGLSLSNKSLLYVQKCSTACCLFEIYLHDNQPVRLAQHGSTD